MDAYPCVPCHLDLYPARSLGQEAQDQIVSPHFDLIIHRGRIAQMKSPSGRPDVHQITRTSLPVRVYVDNWGSERDVFGILHRAPAPLDNGEIRGAVNRGTYLDFDQHIVRRFRAIGRRVRVADTEVRVGYDAEADRQFPFTPLCRSRPVTRM